MVKIEKGEGDVEIERDMVGSVTRRIGTRSIQTPAPVGLTTMLPCLHHNRHPRAHGNYFNRSGGVMCQQGGGLQ
jgi:hypothetical protein